MSIKKTMVLVLGSILLLGLFGCGSGQSASGIGKEGYQKISAQEAKKMMDTQKVTIVDVRSPEEFKDGHVPKAILVPNEKIGSQPPKELPDKEATLLVYCRSGRRSKEAAYKLVDLGYKKVYDFGGIVDWPYATEK